MIEAEPDPRGLDYAFNFFSLPNERTCFANIRQIPPGHYVVVKDGEFRIRQYWDLDFPDAGSEIRFNNPAQGTDELEALSARCRATPAGERSSRQLLPERRARLDRHPRTRLPGTGHAARLVHDRTRSHRSARRTREGRPVGPLPRLEEHRRQRLGRRHLPPRIPAWSPPPKGPVMDTSCAALMLLAAANRKAGNIVALTGEGADEALAGYVWFKYLPLKAAVEPARQSARTRSSGGSC